MIHAINNEELIEILSDKKNIENIEDLMNKKNCSLERIAQKIESENLEFGSLVHERKFWKIYDNVQRRVNAFLGISPIINPNCRLSPEYEDEYFSETQTMTLNNSRRKILITSFAHEYAHHICNLKGIEDSCSFFEEGFARGIEREIARQFANEERDCTFLYEITQEDATELCKTYLWLCDIHDQKIKKNLLKNNSKEEFLFTYCIGNSYFLMEETKGKKEIYRHVLE